MLEGRPKGPRFGCPPSLSSVKSWAEETKGLFPVCFGDEVIEIRQIPSLVPRVSFHSSSYSRIAIGVYEVERVDELRSFHSSIIVHNLIRSHTSLINHGRRCETVRDNHLVRPPGESAALLAFVCHRGGRSTEVFPHRLRGYNHPDPPSLFWL